LDRNDQNSASRVAPYEYVPMVTLFLPTFTIKGAPQYATIFPLLTQGCRPVVSRNHSGQRPSYSHGAETANRFVLSGEKLSINGGARPRELHSPSGIVMHRSEDNAVCVQIPRSYSASTISVPICHGVNVTSFEVNDETYSRRTQLRILS
jgi:hypothetical protein